MNTYIYLGLEAFEERFAEIDLIINEAKNNFENNRNLYNSLCRSAQVLLLAHFEGYLKELVKNSLDDINNFSSFKKSHTQLKRTYCEYFIRKRKVKDYDMRKHNKQVDELISIFDNLETKFNKDYFSYSINKNPKATILDTIAGEYGIKKFFNKIKKSNLDSLFSNTKIENKELCNSLKTRLLNATKEYPYNLTLDFLEISSVDNDNAQDSLWDEFLNEILMRRHKIAHGRETTNSIHYNELEIDVIKVKVLLYVFTAFICVHSNPIQN